MCLCLCSPYINGNIFQKEYQPKCTNIPAKPSPPVVMCTVEIREVKTVFKAEFGEHVVSKSQFCITHVDKKLNSWPLSDITHHLHRTNLGSVSSI